MTINQIYSELNNVVKGITGFADVTVADHKGFVSLGNDILNSNSGVELFGKSLGDRIARILSEVDSYIARNRMLWTDNITYGSALKIVHFKDTYNSNNDIWKGMFLALRKGKISKYQRIAQFTVIEKSPKLKFKEVDDLNGNERGGYGSTDE